MRGAPWIGALFALLGGVPGSARAAGRPYGYVQGAESLPESALELESWFGFEKPRGGAEASTVDWWIGPVVGITDELEASLYGVFVQAPVGASPGSGIGLGALRFQLSYLLAPIGTWPVDVRVRAEYEQTIGAGHEDRGSPNVWLSGIASYDAGPINFTLNTGGFVELESDGANPWLVYALGTSLDVTGGLRIGVEGGGQYNINDKEVEGFVGPAIGYGVGRVWLATTLGFGLGDKSARYQGRIAFGLAF